MNRAAVNVEATVVSSFTVTVLGSEVPSTAIRAMASLGPLVLGGLRRAAFGDQVKHAALALGRLSSLNAPSPSVLALGQLRGSTLACRVKGHCRPGDGAAGPLDGARDVRGHRSGVRDRERNQKYCDQRITCHNCSSDCFLLHVVFHNLFPKFCGSLASSGVLVPVMGQGILPWTPKKLCIPSHKPTNTKPSSLC